MIPHPQMVEINEKSSSQKKTKNIIRCNYETRAIVWYDSEYQKLPEIVKTRFLKS